MNSKVLYLVIVLLVVLAIAGWSQAWSFSGESDPVLSMAEIEQAEFILDYRGDARLFTDHYSINLDMRSAERIPDNPKDGKVFMEYFKNN